MTLKLIIISLIIVGSVYGVCFDAFQGVQFGSPIQNIGENKPEGISSDFVEGIGKYTFNDEVITRDARIIFYFSTENMSVIGSEVEIIVTTINFREIFWEIYNKYLKPYKEHFDQTMEYSEFVPEGKLDTGAEIAQGLLEWEIQILDRCNGELTLQAMAFDETKVLIKLLNLSEKYIELMWIDIEKQMESDENTQGVDFQNPE